jgi:hypothetical protein
VTVTERDKVTKILGVFENQSKNKRSEMHAKIMVIPQMA